MIAYASSMPNGVAGPVITVGIVTFLILAAIGYWLQRVARKTSTARVEAYRPLAQPLYTGARGRSVVTRGWYPLPEGDRDRFHDGTGWTDHYRVRTEQSRMDDPAPAEESEQEC